MKYLKGLDTLRALAALIVVWSHIELIKEQHNVFRTDFMLFPDAHFSVTLFFVLSGFLITYLLIQEIDKHKTIFLKKFYIRRILRIWPLYYLIIFLSFFLFSADIPRRTIILCLTIFPNVPPALNSSWPNSPQIWSLGVEEQFYLFWPFAVLFFLRKGFIKYCSLFIIFFTFFPHLFNYINEHTFHHEKLYSFVQKFFHQTKFNCMAYGGLLGFLLAKKNPFIRIFQNKIISIISIVIPISAWFINVRFGIFSDEIYALMFGFTILSVVLNPFFDVDNSLTKFLGKISYGIYMYHWMIILLIIKFTYPLMNHDMYNIFVYILSFGLIILISWISYISYERFFLNMKKN